jgi:ABC-type uncharacterized transport system substrate-binding protein
MRDWWKELARGLHELGYVEGRNIEFVWRFGDGKFERLPALANELVQLGVDVIMPATPPAIHAAKSASNSIPIVFPLGSDPVETGLVSNLEHPGANITGMATMSRLQSQPRLALVRECLPTAKRVAIIKHAANPALNLQVDASKAAAPELSLQVVVLGFASADEIEHAFEAATAQSVDAVLPLSDPMASGNAERIGALSLRHKIPVVSPFREITDAGGLLSYGPDLSMLFRRSASLVDQILKGAKPGTLPIGTPSDFELSANLQAAKAFNVPIPPSILSRATYLCNGGLSRRVG